MSEPTEPSRELSRLILQVGDVLLSPEILTECFCCDLEACGGICCVEGDAGAPLLPEEVGELARVIARTYGDQSFKAGEPHNLGDEMADVLWVLLCLANQTGVDLTEELRKNIAKKTERDKDRHKTTKN